MNKNILRQAQQLQQRLAKAQEELAEGDAEAEPDKDRCLGRPPRGGAAPGRSKAPGGPVLIRPRRTKGRAGICLSRTGGGAHAVRPYKSGGCDRRWVSEPPRTSSPCRLRFSEGCPR